MVKPRLLDLFSGAGGAGVGYARAGFDVVGVDIVDRKRYPFEFHKADALEYLAAHHSEFDAVHASPPCQAYSHATAGFRNEGTEYPDLLGPTRAALEALDIPWVIENVPGAPMRADYTLCGCFFGLELRRARHFETSWRGFSMMPTHDHSGPSFTVIGDYSTSAERVKLGRAATTQERNRAMGIDWMKGHELGLAIPPAYTEFIGLQLIDHLSLVGAPP